MHGTLLVSTPRQRPPKIETRWPARPGTRIAVRIKSSHAILKAVVFVELEVNRSDRDGPMPEINRIGPFSEGLEAASQLAERD